jgi:hypothetical protein
MLFPKTRARLDSGRHRKLKGVSMEQIFEKIIAFIKMLLSMIGMI